MTIRHFEVQTRTVSDGWINTWHKNDKPLVFATELAARQAMGEFFQDLPDEMAKSYSVIDYRVRAVHFDDREAATHKEALQIVADAARDFADLIESEGEAPEDVAKIRAAIEEAGL